MAQDCVARRDGWGEVGEVGGAQVRVEVFVRRSDDVRLHVTAAQVRPVKQTVTNCSNNVASASNATAREVACGGNPGLLSYAEGGRSNVTIDEVTESHSKILTSGIPSRVLNHVLPRVIVS